MAVRRRPAKEAGADCFLAVGGGSVMDTAKAANVIFTHGGEPRDWEGYLRAAARRRRAGAARCRWRRSAASRPRRAPGSEVSFAAVIKDRAEHIKFQIGDFPLFPDLAILDPEATATLPAADRRRDRHGRA